MRLIRNIIIIFAAISITGCSEENKSFLTLSDNELTFSVEGGEEVVYISSDGYWNYEYAEDWLLVRQQNDRIRIIVDANDTMDERNATIRITRNDDTADLVTIKQEGLLLTTGNTDYEVSYTGQSLSVPVECNTNWDFENNCNWIEARREGDNIELTILRNHIMEEKIGEIIINAGGNSITVRIRQAASPWYESFDMVTVESGTFLMGAQNDYEDDDNYDLSAYMVESPVHNVTMSSYTIGRYEVSQAQWTAAMGSNPSSIQGDNLPVSNISWEEVQTFISILNETSGKTYRLPTEAEWEFAAKGGIKSQGFKYSGDAVPGTCGWYYSNSEATPHECGSKNPNELGIHDMSGNVREWCNDWFDYYTAYEQENPQGPDYGTIKVNRGGSWTTPAINCRNTYRHSNFPHESFDDLGFRLVLSI